MTIKLLSGWLQVDSTLVFTKMKFILLIGSNGRYTFSLWLSGIKVWWSLTFYILASDNLTLSKDTISAHQFFAEWFVLWNQTSTSVWSDGQAYIKFGTDSKKQSMLPCKRCRMHLTRIEFLLYFTWIPRQMVSGAPYKATCNTFYLEEGVHHASLTSQMQCWSSFQGCMWRHAWCGCPELNR